MDINALVAKIKAHPDHEKIGMILTHNGVVRATARDGRPVSGLKVEVRQAVIDEIVAEQKARPGIVEILVEVASGELTIGDDLLLIAVAGDIRENVIPALSDTLNAIKARGTLKTEYFK